MPPKTKRAGRPIKKFPDLSTAPNPSKESDDLTTLANAAQSVDFNWEKAWPKLDQATERLEQLKSLKTKGGLSKENRRQLLTAANELHTMLVAPSSILDNTPDLYKDEFKNRATALTNAYLLFSLDVAPKDNTEKATYLQMLLEKLVKPIREQPSLWGPHSLQITTAAAKWEELQKTVRSSQLNNFNESAPSKTDNESGRLGQSGIRSSGPLPYYNRQDHPYVPQYMYPHPGPYPPSTFIVQAGPIYGHSNQPYGSWNTPSEPFETRPLAQPDTIQYSEGQYTYHTAFPQQRVLPSAHDDIPPGSSNSPVTPTKYFQNQNISNTSPPPFSDAMEIATPQSLLPLRRPKPVPLSIRGRTDFSTTERQHLKDAANLLTEIPRHPAYSSEMRAVHGYAPVAIMEPEEDGEDEPVQLLSPPKRPISADSNKNSIWKRKRTELGVQHILSDGGVPGPSSTAEIERLDRPRSRQEILYQAIAEEQKEDEKFLADNSHHHAEDYENAIAPTPILTDNQTQFPRRQMKRSLSRNDIAVVEDLTPGFRELMSPVPRERSPDRERWRAGSPIPIQQSVPLQEKVVPSHIRSITRPNRQQVALLPPGGNALGARSPELCINASPLETDTRVFMLEHSPPVDIADVMVNIKREIVPMPSGATDMPGLMSIHERTNVLKPVEAREFYVHKRTFIIAKGNERTTPCKDGTIRLGRYFSLSQEEVSETRDYLRHITGSETNRPKTMMRLTCRPRNGEPPGQSVHTWPDNTMVFLNGKCLLTTSHVPLYIAPEALRTINQIRVKVHPNTVQGHFAVYLEVFSLFTFDEMRTYLNMVSPNLDQALDHLRGAKGFPKEPLAKAKISLLCGGRDHIMKLPVYGKNCTHIERLELSCFLQRISVGPDFDWACPLCKSRPGDDIPIQVDKLVMGIIDSHKPDSKKEYFQITSDGQLCDDSASESETDDNEEDEKSEEEEVSRI